MKIQEKGYRTVTFLNREELDFLDELSKDIFFSYGIHIPRTRLIEEIIDAFKAKEALNRKVAEEELVRMFKREELK